VQRIVLLEFKVGIHGGITSVPHFRFAQYREFPYGICKAVPAGQPKRNSSRFVCLTKKVGKVHYMIGI
jgi:hypothetical protein